MKRYALSLIALVLLTVPVHAQTFNQKPGEWACRLSSFECQNVVMTTGDTFTINEPYSQLYPGAQFVWDGVQGGVTEVTKQLPVYWADGVYDVAYTIGLDDGAEATVTSTVTITHPKPLGRWPLAHLSNTVITFTVGPYTIRKRKYGCCKVVPPAE